MPRKQNLRTMVDHCCTASPKCLTFGIFPFKYPLMYDKSNNTINNEQVLEMSKQSQTKNEVKEMAIPISMGGGAKQAKSPRPRFLPFDFKMPSGDELMAQVIYGNPDNQILMS